MSWFIRRSDLTFGGIRRLLMEKGVREERGIEVGIRWWIRCETCVEFVFLGYRMESWELLPQALNRRAATCVRLHTPSSSLHHWGPKTL